MLANDMQIEPGVKIASPAGRRLEVGDIFVPRNDQTKGRQLPASFRNMGRKVVVFRDGSIAPLAEVKRRFRAVIQAPEWPDYDEFQ